MGRMASATGTNSTSLIRLGLRGLISRWHTTSGITPTLHGTGAGHWPFIPMFIAGYLITAFGYVALQNHFPGNYAYLEIVWYFAGINVL